MYFNTRVYDHVQLSINSTKGIFLKVLCDYEEQINMHFFYSDRKYTFNEYIHNYHFQLIY